MVLSTLHISHMHAGIRHAHRGDVAGHIKESRVHQDGLPSLPSRETLHPRPSVQPGGHRPAGETASVRVQEQSARPRGNETSLL